MICPGNPLSATRMTWWDHRALTWMVLPGECWSWYIKRKDKRLLFAVDYHTRHSFLQCSSLPPLFFFFSFRKSICHCHNSLLPTHLLILDMFQLVQLLIYQDSNMFHAFVIEYINIKLSIRNFLIWYLTRVGS